MGGKWIEVKAAGPAETKDAAAALLIGAGSSGVIEGSFTRPDSDVLVSASEWEGKNAEIELFGSAGPMDQVELTAYLPKGTPSEGLDRGLKKLGWGLTLSVYKDADWSEKWKVGVRPVRVSFGGRSILVKPTWSRAEPGPRDVVVEIDPGMAFGTGSHETTKMCLRAILRLLSSKGMCPGDMSLLDVGTGTGVLAIAAVKLGIGRAVGVDIDPVALRVARKNARLNNTDVTISRKSVEGIRGRFSIVAANILSGELTRLAPVLIKKIKPGGWLILSGVLRSEGERLTKLFASLGLETRRGYASGDWAALVFESSPVKCGKR